MSNEEETKAAGEAGANGLSGGSGNGAEAAPGSPETPETKLAAALAERDEIKDRMLRIAADFENWKRRARKEQDDAEAKSREAVLKDVLDVIDNLERAVSAYGPDGGAANTKPVDGAEVLKGVGLVLRLFQTKLERYGVTPIVARGQAFDPRLHEAISKIETSDVAPGAVAVELQRGYKIGDRLLRPALVSVATSPAGARGGEGGSA